VAHPLSAPPSPAQTAAGIATGVLCLWIPFTLIVAMLLSTLPPCAGSRAPICTPPGHLIGTWSATTGAAVGLLTVAIGCWVNPRRHHALFALAGLAVAAAGLLITLGLASTAPVA
jgi:hypothetical protein